MQNIDIDAIRHDIYSAKEAPEEWFEALANQFGEATLGGSEFSEKGFSLIIEILSVDALFSKKGIWVFILQINGDEQRFSAAQKARILAAISMNYARYDDLEFCWTTCDLIARWFDETIALNTFRDLDAKATLSGREGIALGRDVILRRPRADKQ